MSYTLVEASKLSNDVLAQGVVELFVQDDPLLMRLEIEQILGNAYKYDREASEDSAEFYAANADWNYTTFTVDQHTVTTKILGSAAEIDHYTATSRGNINDLKAEILEKKTKALKKQMGSTIVYGDEDSNAKEFDGLQQLISSATYNTIVADDSDTQTVVLSCQNHLDTAIDMIKGFNPTMILMSKGMKRNLTTYLRSVGSINTGRDEFSKQVQKYGDAEIPIYGSDYILNTELTSSGLYSAKTGGLTTSIYILSLGGKGLKLAQTGGPMETLPWERVPGTNKEWAQIRWYPGMMMESLVSCIKIIGIDADGTVAA